MRIADLILINQYSQGIKDIEALKSFFEEQDDLWKKEAVKELLGLVIQSHPLDGDMAAAIEMSGVKKTSTAAAKGKILAIATIGGTRT